MITRLRRRLTLLVICALALVTVGIVLSIFFQRSMTGLPSALFLLSMYDVTSTLSLSLWKVKK